MHLSLPVITAFDTIAAGLLLAVTLLFGWELGTCAGPMSGTHLVLPPDCPPREPTF